MIKILKCPRVRERPDPASWGMDELLTLAETVELHWPRGPITVPTLRTAIRDGQLAVCTVAGKFFLTRRCVLAMATGVKRTPVRPDDGGYADRPKGGMSEREARAWIAQSCVPTKASGRRRPQGDSTR